MYKLLCVFTGPSRSHNILANAFVRSLLKAGHEVTWVTPYEDNKPQKNLTFVYVSDILKITENFKPADISKTQSVSFILELSRNLNIVTLENKQLRDMLITQQFDAVVTEWFMTEVYAGFAAVQEVPWIVFYAAHIYAPLENLVDDVRSISTVPSIMTGFPIPMNFWQRLANTVSFMLFTGLMWYNAAAIHESDYITYFSSLAQARGVDLPPFRVASSNISLLMLNSHPLIAPGQSLPPNVIHIAGYHIDEGVPLPKDLQEIIDKSLQGVVYFSMGSVVKTYAIPEEMIHELINIFGSLKMTVLWKLQFAPMGLPKNVHIRNWWPQLGILAHPNIRLFITHGGITSVIEAIHFGVPILALPIYSEQPANARRAEDTGYGRVVLEPTFGPQFYTVLTDMLNNDSYYRKAKYMSEVFKNRLTPPSKLISYYVELAIESKGAYHLRSVTYLYKWYERWMLDQAAFLAVALYVLKKIIQKVSNVICGKKQKVQKERVLEKQKKKL